MFYWKDKTQNNMTLTEELLSCDSVRTVHIATAFISADGVDLVYQLAEKHSLSKEHITLCLSEQFSSNNPGELLERLSAICTTKILLEQHFHPKVYLLTGAENKLIFGSSNLTKGGFSRNIEFDYIGTPSPNELEKVRAFFDFCESRATAVNDELIQYYKEQQPTLDEINQAQQCAKRRLTGFIRRNDPFTANSYDFTNSYFSFEDYEIFFARNAKRIDSAIQQRRVGIQQKMLAVHTLLYPSIKKLGIAHHKRVENITSTIFPSDYNLHRVGWIGVRYGKLPHEVAPFVQGHGDDGDSYGFQKHGCLQYSINGSGFDISLFLAVKNGAIDRMKLSEHQYKLLHQKRPLIEAELRKLVGHGFEWRVENGTSPFCLDVEPVENFCDWFVSHDEDGYESYLMKQYQPTDPVLKNKDTIAAEIIRVMTMLQPLYDTMVWRPLKR